MLKYRPRLHIVLYESPESHLYAIRNTCAVHTTGHIDCVSPDVILRLPRADDPRDHWSDVQTFEQ